MNALGFDFGTLYTRAAQFSGEGEPEILKHPGHQEFYFLLPSAIQIQNSGVVCGWEAWPRTHSLASDEAPPLKKMLWDHLFYDPKDHRAANWVMAGLVYFLREGRNQVDSLLKNPLEGVVVPIPAGASRDRIGLIKNAADEAGFKMFETVHESTAVMRAYQELKGKKGIAAVFNFGAGFAEFSLMELLPPNDFRVLSLQVETLGGEDITRRLARNLLTEVSDYAGRDFKTDAALANGLFAEAEKAKCALSHRGSYDFNIPLTSGGRFVRAFSRYEMSLWIQDFTDRLKSLVEEALRQSGLKAQEIETVFLSGGSSRMPILQEMLQSYFGKKIISEINPDFAAVYGAAILARDYSSR